MLMRDSLRPIEHRVVLVGAGNAHLVFLHRWRMSPVPGVTVTLVSDSSTVPYSAMVPGHIAGEYTRDQVFIDLVQFGASAGARVVAEPVARLSPVARQVHFTSRPPLGYEFLSIGLGSVPTPPPATPEGDWSFRLRPLGELVRRLDDLDQRIRQSTDPFTFAIVGGGASGCELALAIRKRFANRPGFAVALLHVGEHLLPQFPAVAGRQVVRALREAGVTIHRGTRVAQAATGTLRLADGREVHCDAVLWATNPAPPPILRESGLELDPAGFLLVRETLQAVSDPAVFGTGDCVSFPAYPGLAKNGVLAVRQGRILFDNVLAAIRGGRLQAFRPQRRWLSMLNTADGSAIASYGPFAMSGRWARRLKDRIDRRWTGMFRV
jgi:selenide,water dikinase